MIQERVYARIGLLGNPSDGYFGRTISLSLKNFYAEVILEPALTISFVPHSIYDSNEFSSLGNLAFKVQGEGYYGGLRLLMVKVSVLFLGVSMEQLTHLHVGSALNCLMQYYGVAQQIPIIDRPALVLSCEEELGITAGLQDRVIQVYGGLVFMDFDKQHMDECGHGRYEVLDPSLLPPLWLMYCENPSESGKVHSTVRKRWLEGDPDIRAGMVEVAGLALQGREALQQRSYDKLASLMDHNFNLRRQMFGDAALGAVNLRMINLARSVGAAAKFTGSGGAIVVLCLGGEGQVKALQELCAAEGFKLVAVAVGPSNVPSNTAGAGAEGATGLPHDSVAHAGGHTPPQHNAVVHAKGVVCDPLPRAELALAEPQPAVAGQHQGH